MNLLLDELLVRIIIYISKSLCATRLAADFEEDQTDPR